MVQPSKCICLVAPTASGKTELALALARELPIEIVSMDSAMVYRGMDIGTAKPTPQERRQAPHHLIDIADPADRYSAGRFVADAKSLVQEIYQRNKIPLIVGGTMMYHRALRMGLAELPSAEPQIRVGIEEEAAAQGWPAMHAQLALVDATAASRIQPNDRQRIQRALEIFRVSGRTLSEHLADQQTDDSIDVTTIALLPTDRAVLHKKIAKRFAEMLVAGFVDEVEGLRNRSDLTADLPSIRSVGYRQIWAALEGQYSLADASDRAIIATRQLAKRQLTWLRSAPIDHVLYADQDDLLQRCIEIVSKVHL